MLKNYVEDYRITWRFCSDFNNKKFVIKKLPDLLMKKVCIMAFDSNMKFYKYENNNFIIKQFELNYDHGYPSGKLELNENLELNPQEEHYLYEVAGMLIHRNLMFEDLDTIDTIYLVLEPIYITYGETRLLMYPLLKFREEMLMLEYRVFPGDYKIDCKEFLVQYSELTFRKIDTIEIDINLFKELFPNKSIDNKKTVRHDGCIQKVCKLSDNTYTYLKDISLDILYYITENDDISWISRKTYSLKTRFSNEKMVKPLLLSITNNSKYKCNESIKNFREFNDYKHYITVGTSLTLGNIFNTYMFADCMDEEILFFQTQISKFRSDLEKMNNKQLFELYKTILDFKHNFFYKYNHLSSVREIMDYMWNELEVEQIIENIKDIIELNLKKSENQQNEYLNKIQLYFTTITVILASSPLYQYFVLPTYSLLVGLKIELIKTSHQIFLYSVTMIGIYVILRINKFLYLKIKKF